MNNLKTDIALILGGEDEKKFFETFFKKIYITNSDEKIIDLYQKYNISIIFLDFEKKKTLKTIREIRKKDKEVVISLLITDIQKDILQELLPLHLSGCLKKPLSKKSFKKLFYEHILVDLNIKNKIKIKSNYIFDTEKSVLYNNQSSTVKLTKQESKLIKLLSLSKDNFLTTESLEYEIWERESSFSNCNNRLKYLVNSTRKKLPKDSIKNIYGMGYKLVCEKEE